MAQLSKQDLLNMGISEEKANEIMAKIPAKGEAKINLKVSEKGALSVYGLGRFPVTLYRGQWERLIGEVDRIKGFITENSDKLSVKPQ